MLGLGQLAAGILAGDDDVGFGRNTPGSPSTVTADQFLDFVAFEAFECPGDDQRPPLEDATGSVVLGFCGTGGAQVDASGPQCAHQVRSVGAGEKCVDRTGDDRTDFIDFRQVFCGLRGDLVHGAKSLVQDAGDAGAHIADVESGEQTPQRALFGSLDSLQQVVDRLLTEAFHGQQSLAVRVQLVDGGQAIQQAGRVQMRNQLGPQPFDVHGCPGGKEADRFANLSRATGVGATDIDATVILHHLRSALGAGVGKMEGNFRPIAAMFFDSYDMWNDFSGFFHHDPVADSYAKSLELIAIMQARPRHDGAGDFDRFQLSDGGQRSGFTDLGSRCGCNASRPRNAPICRRSASAGSLLVRPNDSRSSSRLALRTMPSTSKSRACMSSTS